MINFPDAPSLNQTFSAVGETWKWDGAKWIAFSAAIAGDITSVNVGTGLSGGGTSGDVTVSLTTPVTVANGGTGATTFPISQTSGLALSATLLGGNGTTALAPLSGVNGAVGWWGGGNLVMQAVGQSAFLEMMRVNGSLASPTSVLNGQNIFAVFVDGWAGSAMSATSRGQLTCQATENWTATAQGAQWVWATTPTGGTATATTMTLSGTGTLGVGVTPPADAVTGSIIGGANVTAGAGRGIGTNVYYTGTAWNYLASGYGSLMAGNNAGGWQWWTAPSGTAGAAATLTQTMSLDASGNLRVFGTGAAALLTDRGNQSNYISLVANGGQFQIGNQVGNLAYWDSGANFTIQGSTATKPGGGSWVAPSDRSLKSSAEAWPTGLAEVLKLEPISYRYNDESWNHADTDHIGLDAEDAAAVIPEMARTVPIPRPGDPASPDEPPPSVDVAALDHTPLLFALLNAVKTIDARLTAIEQARPTATPYRGGQVGER